VLAILPAIPFIIRGIESAFGRKSGPDKLRKVLDVVDTLLPEKANKDLAQALTQIISGTVALLHIYGEFRRTSQPKQG